MSKTFISQREGVLSRFEKVQFLPVQSIICRTISAQFMNDNLIAMFELTLDEGEVRVVQEKHYKLVSANQISETDLQNYRNYE